MTGIPSARGALKEQANAIAAEKRANKDAKADGKAKEKGAKCGVQKPLFEKPLRCQDMSIPRKLVGHPDLGTLRLTLGSAKSYITCTNLVPHLVAELSEKQVGPRHKVLMSKIMQAASDHKLTKEEIKSLKDKVKSSYKTTG